MKGGMKPSIAVMIGSAGKGGADHGHTEPDSDEMGGASDADTDDTVAEEMGNAVTDAIDQHDPKALYRAICDIVKYERG